MKSVKELRTVLQSGSGRGAWVAGVKKYALDLLEDMDGTFVMYGSPADMKKLLNGASDWHEYSWGGCALIRDFEIAERLCSPSELKKKKGGELSPNKQEEWLDVQARALEQAANMIIRLARARR